MIAPKSTLFHCKAEADISLFYVKAIYAVNVLLCDLLPKCIVFIAIVLTFLIIMVRAHFVFWSVIIYFIKLCANKM